jgi:hypothetical protein
MSPNFPDNDAKHSKKKLFCKVKGNEEHNVVFSSPELKAQVSFSDYPLSVYPSVCKL